MTSQDAFVDLENRDPNNLNDHVKVCFEDALGEPEGAHAVDCVWVNSYKCFNGCKDCCYKFMSLICGIPLAIFWGCDFAVITFCHVWYITPLLRAYMINCGCLQKFYSTCLQCYVQPYCEACSYFFNNIRVTNTSG